MNKSNTWWNYEKHQIGSKSKWQQIYLHKTYKSYKTCRLSCGWDYEWILMYSLMVDPFKCLNGFRCGSTTNWGIDYFGVVVHGSLYHFVLFPPSSLMSMSSSSLHRSFTFEMFVQNKVMMIFCPTYFVTICLVGHQPSISRMPPICGGS